MKLRYTMIGIIVAFLAISGPVYGDSDHRDQGSLKFKANLSGAQEVTNPPGGVVTDAEGMIRAKFDKALTKVEVRLKVEDSAGVFTRAHFHCARAGQNGPIAFGLVDPGPLVFDGGKVEGVLMNADFSGADCVPSIGRPVNNIAALAFAMKDGLIYINVHSTAFPPGEVRGQMYKD